MDSALTKFIAVTILLIFLTSFEEWTSHPKVALACLVLGLVGVLVLLWLAYGTSAPSVAAPVTPDASTLAPAPAANILPEGTYTTAKISAGDYDFYNYHWAIGQLTSGGTTTPITDWRVVNRVTGHTVYESGNLSASTLVVGGPLGLTIGQAGIDPLRPQYVLNANIGTSAKKQLVLTTTGALQLQDATTGAVLYTANAS